MLRDALRNLEELTIKISMNQKLENSEISVYFDKETSEVYEINYAT